MMGLQAKEWRGRPEGAHLPGLRVTPGASTAMTEHTCGRAAPGNEDRPCISDVSRNRQSHALEAKGDHM